MRFATFNVLHGRSIVDGRVDVDRFADAIRLLDADVLALQEVDRDQPRSHLADLTAVAAEAMGAQSYRFVPALVGTPGERWVAATDDEAPGTAQYGIALLSRYPANEWHTVRMPAIPVRVPMKWPGSRRIVMVHEEPRVAVHARLDTPLGQLTVAATHLAFIPVWNRIQLRRVSRQLSTSQDPLVLMGDLNLARVGITGYQPLATAATFPAEHPDRQIDHILLRGEARVTGATALRLPISDHRALVADLDAVTRAARCPN